MGARAVVVAVSRNRQLSDELTLTLAEGGTSLVTVAADSTDLAAMAALFARFADLPPLHGIYLAAFGGGPVTLADMSDDDVTQPCSRRSSTRWPWCIRCRSHQPLRQFVLFSSISGLTGSRWLAHYTATSTFLDTFLAYARWRPVCRPPPSTGVVAVDRQPVRENTGQHRSRD